MYLIRDAGKRHIWRRVHVSTPAQNSRRNRRSSLSTRGRRWHRRAADFFSVGGAFTENKNTVLVFTYLCE